jgi:hypothetical protein
MEDKFEAYMRVIDKVRRLELFWTYSWCCADYLCFSFDDK